VKIITPGGACSLVVGALVKAKGEKGWKKTGPLLARKEGEGGAVERSTMATDLNLSLASGGGAIIFIWREKKRNFKKDGRG